MSVTQLYTGAQNNLWRSNSILTMGESVEERIGWGPRESRVGRIELAVLRERGWKEVYCTANNRKKVSGEKRIVDEVIVPESVVIHEFYGKQGA
jgi:hypothetical protein